MKAAAFRKHFDGPSVAVIAATAALFIAALFTTGFTHDLLLEAGVFLVSVKLILMSYRNNVAAIELRKELAGIRSAIESLRN